jgi:sugar lactone lactonase YvrE
MFSTRSMTLSIAALAIVATVIVAIIGAITRGHFREVISLPNGFQPEGIASGEGTTFFVGSFPTGAVYRGDVKTGEGEVLIPPQQGHSSLGLKYDPRSDLLFVAGGETGKAFIYNGVSGENVAELQLTTQAGLINDVMIVADAAYLTDSLAAVLYRIPLNSETGALTDPPTFEVIPLSGDYEFVSGSFNTNGIDALPDGDRLIIVNSKRGRLYIVDTATGIATLIDLGIGRLPHADGILLQGTTLYVVRNDIDVVSVVELSPDFSSGEIVNQISSPLFRVPTTIAGFGNALYVVNSRFGIPPTIDTEYEVVRVPAQ